MPSKKFLNIFLLSLFLNLAHGLECTLTKFYDLEPNFYFFTKFFQTIGQSVYFTLHFSFFLFLILIYFLLKGGKWQLIPASLYGTIFVTEVHHFIKGITNQSYYPGMLTSALFPVLGYFYWRELLRFTKHIKS